MSRLVYEIELVCTSEVLLRYQPRVLAYIVRRVFFISFAFSLVQFQDQKWESASEMQCAFGLNNFGRVCSFLWGFVF